MVIATIATGESFGFRDNGFAAQSPTLRCPYGFVAVEPYAAGKRELLRA